MPMTYINPAPAPFEEALKSAHVRSAVFRVEKPDALYWKNSLNDWRDERVIPYRDRMCADWLEHDPREGSEAAWKEFDAARVKAVYAAAADQLGFVMAGQTFLALEQAKRALSPHQRRCIVEAGIAMNMVTREVFYDAVCGNWRTGGKLVDMQLGKSRGGGSLYSVYLTPFGIAMRHYLQKKDA